MKFLFSTILTCCFLSVWCQDLKLPQASSLIEKSDIIEIFGADDKSLFIINNSRNERPHRKKCTVSWDNKDSSSDIFIEIKANNKKSEYPLRYTNDLNYYVEEGISIISDEKVKLKFQYLDSLANTIYSDNLGNDKALVIQKDNEYIVSVHYQEHIDRNVGDFSDKLMKLADIIISGLIKK